MLTDYIDTISAAKNLLRDFTAHEAALKGVNNGIPRERAIAYFNAIMPVWMYISDDERFVLKACFIDNDAKRIMDLYGIQKSAAYERIEKALHRFAHLIYW